jgi:hypothetical protein
MMLVYSTTAFSGKPPIDVGPVPRRNDEDRREKISFPSVIFALNQYGLPSVPGLLRIQLGLSY